MSPILKPSEVFTWPNLVTFVRLLCIPVFLYVLFVLDRPLSAAAILSVLGSTDWVDGWIARRYDMVSQFGAVFDPAVDRLLFIVTVPALVIEGSLPLVLAVVVVVREVLVAMLTVAYTAITGERLVVTMEGKTGTFLLMFAFPLFLVANADTSWSPVFRWLAWFCVAPGLLFSWFSALGQYGTQVYRRFKA